MKRKFFIVVLLALTCFGCSENLVNTDSENGMQSKSNFNWMQMPKKSGMSSVETEYTVSRRIVGNQGGVLNLSGSYITEDNNTVTISSELIIPSRAYNGAEVITQITSTDAAVSDFYPSMSFNSPLILNIKYSGLDLSGVDPAAVGFYYIAESGELEAAQNDGIIVDTINGTIEVKAARLPHFSRYGFI